jgi:hypothetical protein
MPITHHVLVENSAVFSDDRTYRYLLTREIDAENQRVLAICGLNPSVANELDNDPTITREIDFARRWNCGRLVKVNAYGLVSTDPKRMFDQKKRNHLDIVGPENDIYIAEAAMLAQQTDGIILVAWGKNIEPFRQKRLAELLGDKTMCLCTNKDGTPTHPLYQKATAVPIPWKLAA